MARSRKSRTIPLARVVTRVIGLRRRPAQISPVWRRVMATHGAKLKDDFDRPAALRFEHLVCGHGRPLSGGAHQALRAPDRGHTPPRADEATKLRAVAPTWTALRSRELLPQDLRFAKHSPTSVEPADRTTALTSGRGSGRARELESLRSTCAKPARFGVVRSARTGTTVVDQLGTHAEFSG